jgi:hypothetical protein
MSFTVEEISDIEKKCQEEELRRPTKTREEALQTDPPIYTTVQENPGD